MGDASIKSEEYILDNYDITQCERLWNDYKSITKYMPTE